MRLAFVAPEFPTTAASAGGLATFLGRMTRTLVAHSCSVDVFTPGGGQEYGTPRSESVRWHGVTVHHVAIPPFVPGRWEPWPAQIWQRVSLREPGRLLHQAHHLSQALQAHDEVEPYDAVHGADFGLTTWFVPRRPGRVVIVRSSSPTAEYRRWWGTANRLDHLLLSRMECSLFRRADLAYAPSQRTAAYYSRRAGVPMAVIRPPYAVEPEPAAWNSAALPPRFLLHFGNINRVKGSDWLARALIIAWQSAPDLRMVWAGTDAQEWLPRFQRQWGAQASQVTWLGAIPRGEIAAIVAGAATVVAPSRVDNLPNTVLEAQAAGVPVIGGLDSTIEEIVVDGVTGRLVERDDVAGLARALVAAWRGEPPFHQRCDRPPIFAELAPDYAASRLLDLIERCQRGEKAGAAEIRR